MKTEITMDNLSQEKTLRISGYGITSEKIFNLLNSDSLLCSEIGLEYGYFDEEEEYSHNVFIRVYTSKDETTIEDCIKNVVLETIGFVEYSAKEYGYSEYTIEGVDRDFTTIGGHDLYEILEANKDKYSHILITFKG